MSEAAPSSPRDFWRPPLQAAKSPVLTPVGAEVCGCGTEFMVGSRFCHNCGGERRSGATALGWTRYLEFHQIKRGLGLDTICLIAFLIGVGCLLAACTVGVIYSVQSMADFQAVQLWRMQWLLAGIAAFLAGMLLKRAGESRK